jgi:hypothetical protein
LTLRPTAVQSPPRNHRWTPPRRLLATQSTVDAKIEEIQELYATARDEFEIAAEETTSNTVYAEEDRTAAKKELEKLQKVYSDTINGSDKQLADEVKKRVGQRIRELENAMQAMEDMARNQD